VGSSCRRSTSGERRRLSLTARYGQTTQTTIGANSGGLATLLVEGTPAIASGGDQDRRGPGPASQPNVRVGCSCPSTPVRRGCVETRPMTPAALRVVQPAPRQAPRPNGSTLRLTATGSNTQRGPL